MAHFSKSTHGVQLDLEGIIPPMVTAFDPETEELDLELIRQETEYLVSTGVSSIVLAGSTGEGQGMSEEEIELLNRTVVEQAAARGRSSPASSRTPPSSPPARPGPPRGAAPWRCS